MSAARMDANRAADDMSAASVFCRMFDAVDHQHVNGSSGGVELQAQLLLDGSKNRGSVWIDRRQRGRARGCVAPPLRHLIRRPLQIKVVVAGETGLVDNGPVDEPGQHV